MSRDHYLAVQQPLFQHIRIFTFDGLVKLLSTVLKVPVVSYISPQQRRHWYKLSDAELRERDVKSLQIKLDCITDRRIVGAILERCISGIAHKCPDVNISITLQSIWRDGLKQLEAANLPKVKELCLFMDFSGTNPVDYDFLVKQKLWELTFCGLTFPDLKDVYVNTSNNYAIGQPSTILESIDYYDRPRERFLYNNAAMLDGNTFHGLLKMEKIKIERTVLLNPDVLNALFNSRVIPTRLTTLKIVNCPLLHPVDDLAAIATLLQRGLQLLQYLTLHLADHDAYGEQFHVYNYNAVIDEEPGHHLCNIVRVLGQRIKCLDLAIPFACKHMLIPLHTKAVSVLHGLRELPAISQQPLNTLSQRLIKEGYRYRRLILYRGVCRGAHDWNELVDLAVEQHGSVSWDLLSETEGKGTWCVSGCLPVERTWEEALSYPLRDE